MRQCFDGSANSLIRFNPWLTALTNSNKFDWNTLFLLPILAQTMNKTVHSHSASKQIYPAAFGRPFPQDIECIIQSRHRERGSLYISNLEAAQNPDTLQRYSIKAILSCAKGYQLSHSRYIVPHYYYIPAIDHESCEIYPHFNKAVDFIEKHLKTTNVLVHCVAGVSRSVSMVIAYLIREHKMTDDEAYVLVKSRRKIINPNQGFRRQLKQYHQQLKIRSQRSLRTPEKQVTPDYRLYSKSPIKNDHTVSTYEKSRESNKAKDERTTYDHRTLVADYPSAYEDPNLINSLAKAHRKSFEQRYAKTYYSPSKPPAYKQSRQQTAPNQKSTHGYFHNMSQDLDERIERIKQKYEIHRTKLEQRYPKRTFENYLYPSYQTKARFEGVAEGARLKTESLQYPSKARYLNESQQGYSTTKAHPNVNTLFPRTFSDRLQPSQTSRPSWTEGSGYLSNSHYKQGEGSRQEEVSRYAGYKNTRDYRKFN